MTNTLYRINDRISSVYRYIRANSRRSAAAGILIYTLFFALYFCVSLLPYIMASGTLMGSDSIEQYYPYLIELKKNLGLFFKSIADGAPAVPMLNFDFAYGSDVYSAMVCDYMPFLPYYIFTVFVPDRGLPLFYGIGTVLFSYLSGLSFIYMCGHFRRDTVAAGFFAPLYVFSGASFYTGLLNQFFLIMYMAFPFMIAGIDKIICRKGFIMFTFAVFLTAIGGFPYIVYTIPLVVVFAVIRVRFVYKERYFANLGLCFLRGAGACLLGIALAGFIILPCIVDYLTGARSGDAKSIDWLMMLTPDLSTLKGTLVPTSYHFDTGIFAALIPFLLFLFLRRGGTELKILSLVMLGLIALPLIRYGLNGFNYSICRWGFVSPILFSFVGVCTIRGLTHARKEMSAPFAFSAVLYIVLVTLGLGTAAAVLLTAAGIINTVPFTSKAVRSLKKRLSRLKENEEAYSKLRYAVGIVLIVAGIFAAVYIIAFVKTFIPALILVCLVSAAAVPVFAKAPKARPLVCVLFLCVLTVSVTMTFDLKDGMEIYSPEALDEGTYDLVVNKTKEYDDGVGFGRMSMMSSESREYTYPVTDDEEETTEDTDIDLVPEAEDEIENPIKVYPDPQGNAALRYGIPDTFIFKSSIDSDLMSFVKRNGQDFYSAYATVDMQGFSGKEAIYSLFGVRYMMFPREFDRFYGTELAEKAGGDSGLYMYINKYALPAGVTYSVITDKERFESFDAAELAYGMLNEVYLEGYDGAQSGVNENYARRCEFTQERSLRGTLEDGIDVYNNTVTINGNTSDCFLFLTFEGVNAVTGSGLPSVRLTINADDKYIIDSRIHNKNYNWEWVFKNDIYSISLGHFDEGVKKLDFISAFDYDEMYITAVPAEIYTKAYADRTENILEDLTLSVNTLEGNITLSEPKALCISLLHNNGWKAYVDGVETPVYKANGLFLGVMLEPGTHRVRLEYTTPQLFEGVCMAAAALLIIIICQVIRRTSEKRKKESRK
ncbi:MAG: YfhO family protein [Ruminiclostridium sp.]|nr:YfhO family protein [Ruminiclostridium sp.]